MVSPIPLRSIIPRRPRLEETEDLVELLGLGQGAQPSGLSQYESVGIDPPERPVGDIRSMGDVKASALAKLQELKRQNPQSAAEILRQLAVSGQRRQQLGTIDSRPRPIKLLERGAELAMHVLDPVTEVVGPMAVASLEKGLPAVFPAAVALTPSLNALNIGQTNPESQALVIAFLLGKGELSAVELGRRLEEEFGDRNFADQVVLSIAGDPTLVIPVGGTLKALRTTFRIGKATLKEVVRLGGNAHFALNNQRGLVRIFQATGEFRTVIAPSDTAKKVFNHPVIESGLSGKEQVKNIGKRILLQVPADDIATPAMKATERMQQNVASVSTAFAHKHNQAVRSAFDIDSKGFVQEFRGLHPQIKGAPGFSDLAENFGFYRDYMNPEQVRVMEQLRDALRPVQGLADELQVPLLQFADEGFYVPRGAVSDGVELVGTGKGSGAASFAKPRIFKTHAEGLLHAIDNGYTYPSLQQTLKAHMSDLGTRSGLKHVGRYFTEAVDPYTGQRVSSTAASRIPADIRATIEGTRGKIIAAKRTITGQDIRTGMAGREAGRALGTLDRAVVRTGRAGERVETASEGFTPNAVRDARDDLAEAIADTKDFAFRMGENKVRLQQATSGLTRSERGLFDAVDELSETVAEADRFLQTAASQGSVLDVRAAGRQADRLTNRVVKMADKAEAAEAKVDGLIEQRQILRDLSTGARAETLAARKLERNAMDQRRTIGSLEREWRALKREQRRAANAAERAGGRLETATGRREVTTARLNELEDTMNEVRGVWQNWLRRGTPHGTGPIDLPTLQGQSFPAQIANAANIFLQKGFVGKSAEAAEVYNNFYRGIRATGDLSAPGIQGLLAMPNAPGATVDAMRVMFHSIGSEQSLGAFINKYDEVAVAWGRLTSNQWALDGIRLGGADTEMALGRTGRGLSRLPIVKQANRAFGFYGDALRLQWADDILAEEMKRGIGQGRGLQEMRASGDLERITDFVNNATGWSRNRSFGSLGDLLLFAPRFLNSRLTTVSKSVRGIRPNAPLDQRLARRSLGRLIGSGTMLTIGVNELLGQPTDFHPFLDDQFQPTYIPTNNMNPNFMRIRAFGRDWSVFGTWDSLGRAIITTAGGSIVAGNDIINRRPISVNPVESLQSLGSGLVQTTWETISGRTFMGDEVPRVWEDPVDFSAYLIQAHLPFATEESGEIAQQAVTGIRERDPTMVAGAVVAGGGELFGVKSQPVTITERQNIARQNVMGELGLEGEYRDLDRPDRDRVDGDERVKAITQEKVEDRRRRHDAYQTEFVDKSTNLTEVKDLAITTSFERDGYGKKLRLLIDSQQTIHGAKQEQLRDDNEDLLEFFNNLDPRQGEIDVAIDAYRKRLNDENNPWVDPITREPDFDKREEILKGLRDEFGGDRIATAIKTIHDKDPGVVKELRADRETLRPYFDLTHNVIEAYGALDIYARYIKIAPKNRRAFLATPVNGRLKAALAFLSGSEKRGVKKAAKTGKTIGSRRAFRLENPALDKLLRKWGYTLRLIDPSDTSDSQEDIRLRKEGAFSP
jgi:uncharacterized coiled-coil DUF342 family protein